MANKKKVLIAGGDLRQIYCGKYLADHFDVSFMGFDLKYLPDIFKSCEIKEKDIYDYVVLPVPPVQEELYINTPFYSNSILIEKLKGYISADTVFFGGKLNDNLRDYFIGNEMIDYLEREELSVLNAIPTAEGAIQIALEEMPITLNGCKVLITGFGRIGKALVSILQGFGADISVVARSTKAKAWARVMRVKTCSISEIDSSFALVLNTAPNLIFDTKILKKLSSDSLIIDLASKPGGVDFKTAGELGLKVVWALGLPGKVAPITAGEMIASTIVGVIEERGDDNV